MANPEWAKDFFQKTVTENPYLNRRIERVWEGANPRQFLFLTWPAREILYGGAAGGGKSVSLLAAALQFVTVPGYAALLLRKTFQDLNKPDALIPLSAAVLNGTDAKWNEQLHRWKFPSGATLSFGYLSSKNDHLQYQGAAFQFIGFDEATQFPENQYLYLHSRLRKAHGLDVPLRMRAASNPGGPGHSWVKARFVDPDTRADRVFIFAKMEDNPKLDRDSYERSLQVLDPTTRRQFRHGDWNVVAEAGVFQRSWLRHYEMGDGYYQLGPRRIKISDCSRFGVMDVAGTSKFDADNPDYSVCGIFDVYPFPPYDLILVDQWRDQVEIPDGVDEIMKICYRHDVPWVGIEKNGMGTGTVSTARKRGLAVKPLVARSGVDKVARSQVAQIRMEAGSVWFPVGLPITEELESELMGFPTAGMHDDQVDVLSWACILVQKLYGAVPVGIDAERQEQKQTAAEALSAEIAPDAVTSDESDPDAVAWLNR